MYPYGGVPKLHLFWESWGRMYLKGMHALPKLNFYNTLAAFYQYLKNNSSNLFYILEEYILMGGQLPLLLSPDAFLGAPSSPVNL